ncbi:MAG TPA: SUF system NifU family Fe-S cluster assembly protein [Phaeodactylibacter sp.]|nr:SUF system NifU family Fe-S cluster assembly protein [Phaeodactylibacter sp.]
MSKKLTDLYKGIILSENKNPFHYEKMEDASHVLEAYNSFCGDHFFIYIKEENGKITAASFHGYGCAISKASTSILVQKMIGKELKELKFLCQQYFSVVRGGDDIENAPEVFFAFQAAKDFPTRIKCATLSWEELEKFLEK